MPGRCRTGALTPACGCLPEACPACQQGAGEGRRDPRPRQPPCPGRACPRAGERLLPGRRRGAGAAAPGRGAPGGAGRGRAGPVRSGAGGGAVGASREAQRAHGDAPHRALGPRALGLPPGGRPRLRAAPRHLPGRVGCGGRCWERPGSARAGRWHSGKAGAGGGLVFFCPLFFSLFGVFLFTEKSMVAHSALSPVADRSLCFPPNLPPRPVHRDPAGSRNPLSPGSGLAAQPVGGSPSHRGGLSARRLCLPCIVKSLCLQ